MDNYDVRFWDIKKLGNGSGGRFRVRWAVNGREHCKSFKGRPLADGFLAGLKDAVGDRRPFNPRTGLPNTDTTGGAMVTWYQHARAYTEAKWPNLAPVSRRSVAEALVSAVGWRGRLPPDRTDLANTWRSFVPARRQDAHTSKSRSVLLCSAGLRNIRLIETAAPRSDCRVKRRQDWWLWRWMATAAMTSMVPRCGLGRVRTRRSAGSLPSR